MRVTVSVPDPITRLIEQELAKQDDALAAACRDANKDRPLQREIEEWQDFDDDIKTVENAIATVLPLP